MILNYAGKQIAAENLGGETIAAFLPEVDQQNQINQPLRAAYAQVIPRGNRQWVIPFRIYFGPRGIPGDMLADLSLFPGTLPPGGALTWSEDGRTLTCNNAAFRSFKPAARVGVSAYADLIFDGGGPIVEIDDYIQDENGNPITDDVGGYILTN